MRKEDKIPSATPKALGLELEPLPMGGCALGAALRNAWPCQGREGGENEIYPLPSLAICHASRSLGRREGHKCPSPNPTGLFRLEFYGSGPLGSVLGLGGGCRPFSGWYLLAQSFLSKERVT